MDTTYTIKAHDGQTYGPYPLANIQAWIAEGRIGAETPMTRSDLKEWFPAGSFSELNFTTSPAPAVPQPVQVPPATTDFQTREGVSLNEATLASVKPGASWFYWIAGLTAVNALAWIFDGGIGFALAFQLARVAARMAEDSKPAGIVIYLVSIGFLALCGWFASKGAVWAFVIGGLAVAADTWLCLKAEAWLSVAFHAWALFSIFGGMMNAIAIKKALRR